ncbi:MAG: hypothetical protein RMJ36_04530 [Candidatus Calescibacterium sp.]|nr:hypothetical protein [Candidatus Calescibacterium sp.]MDW8132900.1 hypothetical protein [Candidatus Calescibacterium sp.]
MNKTLSETIKVYTNPTHGTILSKILKKSEIIITESKDNIYTISEEKIQEIGIEPSTLKFSNNNNLIFWKNKIGITRKNNKVFFIEEKLIQTTNFNKIDKPPSIEELSKDNSINVTFERYPLKHKVNLHKVKLKSHINHNFVDNIIDNLFKCSVINMENIMWIYLYGEDKIEEVIDYYQKTYNVNTDILEREKEEITPFDFAELVPNTENISFLGYKNGLFNPYKFTDLDFIIDFYKIIGNNLHQIVPKLLEIKEMIDKINIDKIIKDISKFAEYDIKLIL